MKIDLEEMNVIIRIPKNSKKLEIRITLDDNTDTKTKKVKKKFKRKEIQEARNAFLGNVEFGDDYDDTFVLTDEGMEYLKSINMSKENSSDNNR